MTRDSKDYTNYETRNTDKVTRVIEKLAGDHGFTVYKMLLARRKTASS